jgi:hypothetical protein
MTLAYPAQAVFAQRATIDAARIAEGLSFITPHPALLRVENCDE